MGYYSQVGFAMSENKYNQMLEEAEKTLDQKALENLKYLLEKADTNKKIKNKFPATVIKDSSEYIRVVLFDYIKWYTDDELFPEVNFIDNYLKWSDFPYDYIVLGEDVDDNEEDLHLYVIALHREIRLED